MIWLNRSKVLQSISMGGRSIHLPPHWSVNLTGEDEGSITFDSSIVRLKDPRAALDERPDQVFAVARGGGLGDVIMLLPVLRVLLSIYPKLRLRLYTTSRHARFLELSQTDRFMVLPDSRRTKDEVDLGISLEGVVEKDHSGRAGRYSKMPRHAIFAESLGILNEVLQVEHGQDFTITTSASDIKQASKLLTGIRRPIVGIQVRGNELSRTLPLEQVIEVIALLARLGYAVVPLDACWISKLKGEHVHQFPKASLREVLEIMRQCKFLITMESGLLHLAHSANAPLICFYGPTRVEERGAFHPSFSRGWVIPIKLNELHNCEPCFMQSFDCRRRYRCIQRTPTLQLLQQVEQAVLRMQSTLGHDR